MTVALTEQQQLAVDAARPAPPVVVDPRNAAAYVLIPLDEYESVRESLEDSRCQRAIRSAGLRNAAGRMLAVG